MLLNTLFSNTLRLCSSLKARDRVSHPYRTTGKIIVLFILMFMFDDDVNNNNNSLVFICQVSSYKVNYRHSTMAQTRA
jgi:hypothetical protein